MEDDHVDRPGVEERQRLKLTGTNSSIGLIVLIPNAHPTSRMVCSHSRLFRPSGGATWVRCIGADGRSTLRSFASKGARLKEHPRHKGDDPWIALEQLLEQRAFCRPGGYGGAAAPDPIPNSAVKRSSADGTSSQDAGE